MFYIGIIITYVLVNNFILTQFMGLCPFIGVSRNVENAIGMGFALTFTTTLASIVTWVIQRFVLVPLHIEFLQTISFILVIAGLVQFIEIVIQKISPPLYKALGIYLPLITTNCIVLGIAVLNVRNNYDALGSFLAGFSAGLGFLLAIILMSTIREKLDFEWIPKPFRGMPNAFVTGGLMALAFMAFDKALLANLLGTV
jgi:electron transport complex protein RnfA